MEWIRECSDGMDTWRQGFAPYGLLGLDGRSEWKAGAGRPRLKKKSPVLLSMQYR